MARLVRQVIPVYVGIIQSQLRYYKANPIAAVKNAVSMVPGIGDGMDAMETISGRDALSGEQLSTSNRVLSGVGLAIPGIMSGRMLREGAQQIPDTLKKYPNGSMSIINWDNYPADVPKPTGSVNIIEGDAYQQSRQLANSINKTIHNSFDQLKGMEIHEIQPIKFGGSATDLANKIPISRPLHRKVTAWWNKLQKTLEK